MRTAFPIPMSTISGATKVQLHAFSGNYKSAAAGIAAGFYFSVPPSSILSDQVRVISNHSRIPFIRAHFQKKSLFDKIPLEQLLLETDSPVLGPVKEVSSLFLLNIDSACSGVFQERNEPANLRFSVDFIAKLKKVDPEMVIKQTTENALKLFPKLLHYVKL